MADRKFDREELVPLICARLSTGKEPLSVILADLGLQRRTVDYWRKEDAEIAAQFDEARDTGYDNIAADCLQIADDKQHDHKLELRGGNEVLVVDNEVVQRSKLRVETRLKLLARWDPRRYGDRMTLAGDPKNPLHVSSKLDLTEAQLLAIAAQGAAQGDKADG